MMKEHLEFAADLRRHIVAAREPLPAFVRLDEIGPYALDRPR